MLQMDKTGVANAVLRSYSGAVIYMPFYGFGGSIDGDRDFREKKKTSAGRELAVQTAFTEQ